MRFIAFVAAACSSSLTFATIAPAQEAAGDPYTAPVAVPAEQRSKDRSDEAYAAYERGDHSGAIALYLEAYQIVPDADLLYNVARIYDVELRDETLAVEYYRRHNASADAKPTLVGRATARIAALEAPRKPEEEPAAVPPPAPAPPPPPPEEDGLGTQQIAGLVVGGLGGVSLGIGLVGAAVASSEHDEAGAAGCVGDVCPTQEGVDSESSAGTWANVATGSFVAAGALLAAGVVLFVTAPSGSSTPSASITAVPTVDLSGSAGLMAVGRF